MDGRLNFLAYQWPLFAVSTLIFIIGFSAHLLVLIFTSQCSKNDNRTYLVLIKAYSTLGITGTLSAYLGGLRSEMIFPYSIFIPYGPGRYLFQPRLIALLDSLNTQLVPMAPLLLATMMVFRALIMFNYRFKKRVVYLVLLLIFLITLPLNILFVKNYVPIEDIEFVNVSRAVHKEFHAGPSYAILFDEAVDFSWKISNYVPIISIVIGFGTLILMLWKLHSLRSVLGKSTKKLHTAFMMLLALDLIVIVFYSLLLGAVFNDISQKTADFISMFTYPIYVFPVVLQGIMSLIFVPYLRAAFISMLKGRKFGKGAVTSPKITISIVKTTL